MIRRNARLRKEYLYRKGLEGKERVAYENKRKVRQALEGMLACCTGVLWLAKVSQPQSKHPLTGFESDHIGVPQYKPPMYNVYIADSPVLTNMRAVQLQGAMINISTASTCTWYIICCLLATALHHDCRGQASSSRAQEGGSQTQT